MKQLSILKEPQWRACTLVSGSSGNSVFLAAGRTKVLIDAGVAAKSIEEALRKIGEDAADLDAIFVTHEHSDHVRGVGPLARRYKIPIYTNARTFEAMEPNLGNLSRTKVELFTSGEPFGFGDFLLTPFRTSHDAVESVGYRLDSSRFSASVCTDLGEYNESVLKTMAGIDLVFLEANYDEHLLLSGSYPWNLKQRIKGFKGHLSNEDSGTAAGFLVQSGTEKIVLSHLSKENNLPDLAELTVRQILAQNNVMVGQDVILQVAPRYEPGVLHNFQG